ncbi:MAG: hypothetical protein ACREKS_16410 [Candidatus Rokuibacteriota bacterium]
MITLVINGRSYSVDAAPEAPLLWVIRERLRRSGTKYGGGSAISRFGRREC